MSQISKAEFEMKERDREREESSFLQKSTVQKYSDETQNVQNRAELLEKGTHQSICRLRSHPVLLSGNVGRNTSLQEANRNRHFSST